MSKRAKITQYYRTLEAVAATPSRSLSFFARHPNATPEQIQLFLSRHLPTQLLPLVTQRLVTFQTNWKLTQYLFDNFHSHPIPLLTQLLPSLPEKLQREPQLIMAWDHLLFLVDHSEDYDTLCGEAGGWLLQDGFSRPAQWREEEGETMVVIINRRNRSLNHPEVQRTIRHEIQHGLNHYLSCDPIAHNQAESLLKDEILAYLAEGALPVHIQELLLESGIYAELFQAPRNKMIGESERFKAFIVRSIALANEIYNSRKSRHTLALLAITPLYKWGRLRRHLGYLPPITQLTGKLFPRVDTIRLYWKG